jgi:hypothetical protein
VETKAVVVRFLGQIQLYYTAGCIFNFFYKSEKHPFMTLRRLPFFFSFLFFTSTQSRAQKHTAKASYRRCVAARKMNFSFFSQKNKMPRLL